MPVGTITLTNNSVAVTGSGTAFTTELKANDFVVAVAGGTTYTLGVKAVGSATALTLITPYDGPTVSGLAWTAVPNQSLVGITAQIATDTARAIRGLNYDKNNWQQLFTGSGIITVQLPDGSTYTGPSWNSIQAYADALLPIGMRIDWPSLTLPDNPALGIKFLRLNGAAFSKTLYPKLGAIYTSGVLPDMRGDTVRGYDDGRGIDQGRALLSEQADAIQNITGSMDLRPIISNGQPYANRLRSSGAFSGSQPAEGNLGSLAGQQSATTITTLVETITFDAGRIARTSTETRMRNMAWNMIVRAS
jgi:hypothetical protein